MKPIRIGLMGLGGTGRQLLSTAHRDQRFEVVAISDIGRPEILHHLLTRTRGAEDIRLEGNYLVGNGTHARLMPADQPTDIPWDVFGVDIVIETTGRFRTVDDLTAHLDNGAPRVLLSTLPAEPVDRVVLYGVNHGEIRSRDRIVSAGSASTTATALTLQILSEAWRIEQASMTSVHGYTSDQSLADRAGPDHRRSRSGAENIIPNETPALHWVQQVMPELRGRLSAYALNVPVQVGSMLDVTVSLADAGIEIDAVRDHLATAAGRRPNLVGSTADPIVSSDVRGSTCSLLFDLSATMRAGEHMLKLIGWHESLGHATRMLDLVADYSALGAPQQRGVE